jgi:ribonuclease D
MFPEFQLIQTMSELESLGKQLAKEPLLAVDIEADSLHHYFPKVCLIQISTQQHTFLIDPLAVPTTDVLQPLFGGHKAKKIFHGADYDLRSLFRDFAVRVNNLFDTMVASQFVGEKEVGLAAVLEKRFGILLNKKYQRANWSKRPLRRDMLVYAANDTAHLIRLYQELEQELESKGRLDWVEEECKLLALECAPGVKPRPAYPRGNGQNTSRWPINFPGNTPLFRRFKGAGKMTPRDLAILESLLAFRERTAMKQDRPPFKVFGNHVIRELVKIKPADYSSLKNVPGLPADFMRRYAKGAIGAIRRGLELPEDRLPFYPRTPRPPRNPQKQARLKRLKSWRDLKAGQLEIESGLLCNNTLLDALAEGNPKDMEGLKAITGMKTWQINAFGVEIVEVLQREK